MTVLRKPASQYGMICSIDFLGITGIMTDGIFSPGDKEGADARGRTCTACSWCNEHGIPFHKGAPVIFNVFIISIKPFVKLKIIRKFFYRNFGLPLHFS